MSIDERGVDPHCAMSARRAGEPHHHEELPIKLDSSVGWADVRPGPEVVCCVGWRGEDAKSKEEEKHRGFLGGALPGDSVSH